MFGIQPIHIVVIVLVALLIFGPRKLPEMGRSIGKAISEFRNSTREMTDALREEVSQPAGSQAINNGTPVNTIGQIPAPPVVVEGAPAASATVGNFCIQCGASNMPKARFCNQCGTKLPEKSN